MVWRRISRSSLPSPPRARVTRVASPRSWAIGRGDGAARRSRRWAPAGRRPRDADPRRHGLHQRDADRARDARRPRLPDLRGYGRDPAPVDRAQLAEGTRESRIMGLTGGAQVIFRSTYPDVDIPDVSL